MTPESSVDLDSYGEIIRAPQRFEQSAQTKRSKALQAGHRVKTQVAKRPEAPRLEYRKHVPQLPKVKSGTIVNPGAEAGKVRLASDAQSWCDAEECLFAKAGRVVVRVVGGRHSR